MTLGKDATNFGYVEMLEKPRKPFHKRWFGRLEPGSVNSTSVVLMGSALGAGCLALPYAFRLTGIGLGLLTLVASGLISALSLQTLMVASHEVGVGTYADLLDLATGSKVASVFLDVVIMLNGWGTICAILIFEGDLLPDIVQTPPKVTGLSGFVLSRQAAILAAAAAVWPLTLPDDISALRYVALGVPAAITTIATVVLMDSPEERHLTEEKGFSLAWWEFDFKSWVMAASIMINAFSGHSNAVPATNSMKEPTVWRIVKSTLSANIVVFILYAFLGLGGYLSFASDTKGDFLLNYAGGKPEIWTCRLMLAIIVYCALPVSLLPTAKSAVQLLFRCLGRDYSKISGFTHGACATILLLGAIEVALNIENVAFVINFVGGLLATCIMFWFPAIIFYQVLWHLPPKLLRWPILITMVFFGAVGWTSVLMSIL